MASGATRFAGGKRLVRENAKSLRKAGTMFGREAEETHELCREVIADLMQRPAERFYAGEQIALNAAATGLYAHDQELLDWLFDLRRVTGENLEGTTKIYNRPDRLYPEVRNYRRDIMVPYMPRVR
jgi:hypothetical protein